MPVKGEAKIVSFPEQVDYLVIGHVTRDLVPGGAIVGGTVSFAGWTARALGVTTAAVTSAGPGFDAGIALPQIHVHCIPSRQMTTFENVYTPDGRVQTIHALADPIRPEQVPPPWRQAAIVHLAPLVGEIEPLEMMALFPQSLIGLTPQGWMRAWDSRGRVRPREWAEAEAVLPLTGAVVLSEEDLLSLEMLEQFRRKAPLLVLTQAERGCTVYWRGQARHFAAPRVNAVAPTGAGDVFAAAFFTCLQQSSGDAWAAARFANFIASASVTATTLAEKGEAVTQAVTRWKQMGS